MGANLGKSDRIVLFENEPYLRFKKFSWNMETRGIRNICLLCAYSMITKYEEPILQRGPCRGIQSDCPGDSIDESAFQSIPLTLSGLRRFAIAPNIPVSKV